MKETRDSIGDVWGERTPHLHHMWAARHDERTSEEPERWVQSACVLCSNGCGLDIGVRGGRIVGVRGRDVDRVNHGRLGPKGLHGWEANHSPERLTRPLVRRGGELVETDWEEAMGLVVSRSKEVRDRYTSGAIGFYNTGQLFLEEYYTLSIIVHAGIGTNNVDGNTRLCTATAAQAYKESFGSDGPPGSFTDFDECDCLLLCGHNMAFTQTVLWMRVLDRRRSDSPPKLVVIDPRETETAREADVVLPAAMWGEKTGTFTNADRTVHISHKAVEPPGEARPDLDIFLDYARRMGFEDRDGRPLVKWSDAEGAFNHWREFSKGWVPDYSGLSYEKLSRGSGIQWPCNEEYPEGKERLYETGAARTPVEYEAHDPRGRAVLKAAHYSPPEEEPDEQYPFWLTTGRVVYHWHTRTKTARSPELQEAAPESFAQISEADAERLGVGGGEVVEVASRRGTLRAPARVGGVEAGTVFVPMHYGYWDEGGGRDEEGGHARAANELTLTSWDPVSKQPYFKFAAVQVRKPGAEGLTGRLADAAGKVWDRASELADKAMAAAHAERAHVPDYVGRLIEANEQFMRACESVAARHAEDAEMRHGMAKLSEFSYVAVELLRPFEDVYGRRDADEPSDLRSAALPTMPSGSFGLLRDLHALYVMSAEVHISLTVVMQASKELRDDELLAVCIYLDEQNKRQQAWLVTQIEHRAAHTLVVPQ